MITQSKGIFGDSVYKSDSSAFSDEYSDIYLVAIGYHRMFASQHLTSHFTPMMFNSCSPHLTYIIFDLSVLIDYTDG